ncbi:MAG TPA: alginate export family protein [Steroidobacteraceae bacterium]|nr:alginate export family protein [Steroidobacteraceae bacterium]
MTPFNHRSKIASAVLLALSATPVLSAEEEAKPTPPPGLPANVDWTFNLDATFGAFGFDNSLYLNPRDEPSGDLGDNWTEGTVKGGLSGVYTNAGGSQWYGKISAVGEGTYSDAPDLVGSDSTSFGVEDLYIGWRSSGENPMWDFTVGRAQYKLGHGMLLYDGASEGGSRGGYWTNARKAFEFAAIGRFKSGSNTFEVFYLDRDELPESDSGSKLVGANYEYAFGEENTLGATYMKWSAKESVRPERDGMEVYNLRAYVAPFPSLKALSFELEWAQEENDVLVDSMAWTAAASYQFGGAWTPKLTYRYALFEGDDPDTVENENFDGLFTGFYDWSSWWQGEIGGGYLLSNSNLATNMLRLHAKPTESISTGLIFLDFSLDHPESFDPSVTSSDAGTELDWYMDWSITSNFILSVVLAVGEPGEAVEQFSGRTENFTYGMIFGAYSF